MKSQTQRSSIKLVTTKIMFDYKTIALLLELKNVSVTHFDMSEKAKMVTKKMNIKL